MYDLPENSELLFMDNRGVYIPQHFAEEIVRESVTGVSDEDYAILESGPDHEWYWETWESVLNRAVITDHKSGIQYNLYQDGDVWLVPVDAIWEDEY